MDNAAARRKALAQRLATAGCDVDTSGEHWLRAGDFTPPTIAGPGLPMGKRLPAGERRGAVVAGPAIGTSAEAFSLTVGGGLDATMAADSGLYQGHDDGRYGATVASFVFPAA